VIAIEPYVVCFLYLSVSSLRAANSLWSRYILLESMNFYLTLVPPYYFFNNPMNDWWKVKLPNYYRRALSSGLILENFYFTDYYVVTPLSCSSGSFMNYIIILNIFNTIHKLKDFFIKIRGNQQNHQY
jgi:hypothetical protein